MSALGKWSDAQLLAFAELTSLTKHCKQCPVLLFLLFGIICLGLFESTVLQQQFQCNSLALFVQEFLRTLSIV